MDNNYQNNNQFQNTPPVDNNQFQNQNPNQAPMNSNQPVYEEPKKKSSAPIIILVVVLSLCFIGWRIFSIVSVAKKNVDDIYSQAKENAFIAEVQNVYYHAQTAFISDTMDELTGKEYSKINGDVCGSESLSDNFDYYIKLNDRGEVLKIVVKGDEYAYVEEGTNIQVHKLSKNNIKSPSSVTVPRCNE